MLSNQKGKRDASRPFFLFDLKICEIWHKVVALRDDLWYHLPVLFFLISFETTLKCCNLAEVTVKTA